MTWKKFFWMFLRYSGACNKLKASQTSSFHVPNTSETFRKNFFQVKILLTSKKFQILLDWVDQAEKKWLSNLYVSVKNCLDIQHPLCGYLKNSLRSGLSNTRHFMYMQYTQTKRHEVFWIRWVLKYFFSLKSHFQHTAMKNLRKKQQCDF